MATPATAPPLNCSCCPDPGEPSKGINYDRTDKTLRPLRNQGPMPAVATGVKGRGSGMKQKAVSGAPTPSRTQA
jgi:hypothetical protein